MWIWEGMARPNGKAKRNSMARCRHGMVMERWPTEMAWHGTARDCGTFSPRFKLSGIAFAWGHEFHWPQADLLCRQACQCAGQTTGVGATGGRGEGRVGAREEGAFGRRGNKGKVKRRGKKNRGKKTPQKSWQNVADMSTYWLRLHTYTTERSMLLSHYCAVVVAAVDIVAVDGGGGCGQWPSSCILSSGSGIPPFPSPPPPLPRFLSRRSISGLRFDLFHAGSCFFSLFGRWMYGSSFIPHSTTTFLHNCRPGTRHPQATSPC